MTLEQLALQGKHNVYNSMAAGVAARLMDIRKETLKQCMSDFPQCCTSSRICVKCAWHNFINDSKATNVNSTWYALEYYDKPIIWITGGTDKGNDYTMLTQLVKSKVKAIVCMGINNKPFHDAFGDIVEIIEDTQSAYHAVNVAYELARKVMLCFYRLHAQVSTFFENYEDRGNQFKTAVKEL